MENSHSKKRESRLGRWAPVGFYSANIITWLSIGIAEGTWNLLPLVLLPLIALTLYLVRNRKGGAMTPDYTLLLITTIIFAVIVVGYIRWRFDGTAAISFFIISGGFSAIMDFVSAFAEHNYEYPGQSRLWVFAFILFGWTSMCGSCLFLAEGILARRGLDLITQKNLLWQAPLLTGVIAVLLDLFIDPIAVSAGYWIWFVKGMVYYDIPLLNFVGWFVLMFLSPLAWIIIIRQQQWGVVKKIMGSIAAIAPLVVSSAILSILLNRLIAVFGWE